MVVSEVVTLIKAMDTSLIVVVLLANILFVKCQTEEPKEDDVDYTTSTLNPNYSFSYGVADGDTGDMKSVWEEKDGDTVKGHYSVLEADGSMRTVEYSASPTTGFQAIVNNNGEKILDNIEESNEKDRSGRSYIEDKAMRDYAKYYDFSEDGADFDGPMDKPKSKHPFDSVFKDFSSKKKSKYPSDLESSDFSHSITIKHPRGEAGSSVSESHSHFGLDVDPHCKDKHKKPVNSIYSNVVEFDIRKPQNLKYPLFTPETYGDDFENKYEPSNVDIEKLRPYGSVLKNPYLDPMDYDKLTNPYAAAAKLKLEDYNLKPYKYPYIPDIPSEDSYEMPLRPKKKYRYRKKPEHHHAEVVEYWTPKKKKKVPVRVIEPEYMPEDEEFASSYENPRYPDFDEDERPYRERERDPPRGKKREVVRKVIKKRKPAFNLLDILDI